MSEVEINVTLPRQGAIESEKELLRRLDEFGAVMGKDYGVARIEWWTEGEDTGTILYFKATMPDEVFFQAAISPIMFHELLTEQPLDDFFEHMHRELTLRVDEWERGLHAPRSPDLTEHVVGYREWNVDWSKGTLGPVGIGGAPWLPRTWQQAECRGGGRYGGRAPYGHRAPHPECHCGLYAVFGLPDAPSYSGKQPHRIWGVVQAKGRIEVHRNGFRAEHARPVMLALAGIQEWYVPNPQGKPGKLVSNEDFEHLDTWSRQHAQPVESEGDEEIRKLAKKLGLDAVRWDFVRTKAEEYGKPIPASLQPE